MLHTVRILFILCCGLGPSVTILHAQTQKAPSERKFFDSAGVPIHYTDAGEGEAVILIHGFGANLSVNWSSMTPKLATEFRVVALDNRGHGFSGKPHTSGAYGLNMVEDIIRLMDHLKIGKAHIVGYSMGALITGKFLAEHPDRVHSAVIGGMGYLELDNHWKNFLDEVAGSIEAGKGPMPLLKYLNSRHTPPRTEEDLRTLNALLTAVNDQKALAACARQFPEFAFPRSVLENNQIPVLSVVGDIDPFKDHVDAMKGFTKNVEFAVVKGDHMTAIRNPELLNHIKKFLNEHRAADNR